MGRKGSWLSSVKKALSPNSKRKKKAQQEVIVNEKGCGPEDPSFTDSSSLETITISHPPPVPVKEDNLAEAENEQSKHAYSVAAATAAAAEAAAAAAQAAAEVVRLAASTPFAGKSREEVAAIRIQTAFRGYLARRALKALRGLVRLKSLVDGPTVRRQTANTLKSMQALSRVQAQICSRRIRMSEENRALQRQLLQKRAKELDCLRMGGNWDDSLQSKEQIEASLLHKFEAAMRRERALAYSYSHQQSWKKSSSRPTNLLFSDPTNPQWGWSWLERWMAAQPWEQGYSEKESNGDHLSLKSSSINVGDITKSFARHQLNSENSSSPANQKPNHYSNHQSPATPSSKQVSSLAARKLKPASPRVNAPSQDDDSRSIFSLQSEKTRRHSIAGSSVRDDESLASSPSVPSYMASTKSAKAKSRLQSPLGMENGTPEKGSTASTKKRLSYPPSPARPRRHSGPPKVETSTITEQNGNKEGDE